MRHASIIPALEITSAAVDLAQAIQLRGLIPPGEVRDALHISVATVWKADYLLTWNCKHIANAQIVRQLEKYVKTVCLHLLYPISHLPPPEGVLPYLHP